MSTFNFHSIDLNSYLYMEKRTLAKMAAVLGNTSGAAHWAGQADTLLPRLQQHFYKPDPSGNGGGFFQDRYFNGTFLDEQGCEGYAALFCQVATDGQAAAVATTLSDPTRFLLNFSLPTVSALNKKFNANGYWKGSTWMDQVGVDSALMCVRLRARALVCGCGCDSGDGAERKPSLGWAPGRCGG